MKKTQTRPNYDQTAAGGQKPYRTFEDLEVYQVAREFRKAMYGVNRQLPSFEKFELGSQIRRAAVSLTNNVAEGHGRFHYLEQLKFCLNARGSLEELIDDLNVCEDESYLASDEIKLLETASLASSPNPSWLHAVAPRAEAGRCTSFARRLSRLWLDRQYAGRVAR